MTDRELLELAAKAYWGTEIDDVCTVRWLDEDQAIGYTHADNQDHNGCDLEFLWNPLTDDGDALRLAVKLDMQIWRNTGGTVSAMPPGDVIGFWTRLKDEVAPDPWAAYRRAIVRAAAEIGKAMQQEHRRTTP